MSKKHRHRPAQPEEAAADAVVAGAEASPAAVEIIGTAASESAQGIPAAIRHPEWCSRFVTFDSLRWRCACGASGRVGRTADGIPDTSGDILLHRPGESKE